MQKIPEKIWVIIGLVITGLVFSVLAFTTEVPEGGADNYAHFNIARWAFRYPHLFLDHWGKPVFTILSAPFAQLGFEAVRIFNSICGLLTAWYAYKLARLFVFQNAWFAPVVVVFTPIYFSMMSTGMTEVLFSLILMVSVYLFFKEKYILSALIISFIFLVRTEGLAFLLSFLIAFILKRQYRAIPLLATGFVVFSFIGWIYHYHNFLWLINELPYAKGGTSVYGSGNWYHFIVKMPVSFGIIITLLLYTGSIFFVLKWIKEKGNLKSVYFLQILLILGAFWGYFFIHSFLWWKGETSAGLYRVMTGVSPMIAIIGLHTTDRLKRVFMKKKSADLIMIFLFVFLLAGSVRLYYITITRDLNAEVLKRTTNWLIQSGSLKYKIVMNNPYFAFATGIDAWNKEHVLYSFSDNEHLEKGLTDSTLFIWDAHFSPNEGYVPLEKVMNNPNFEVIKSFDPLLPFKVMGNIDYKIIVFRKIANKNIDNYRLLEKLKRDEFNQGIYYSEINDFQNNFPDQNMETRRLLISSDNLNYVFSIDNAEFSPGFQIEGDVVEKAIKNKFRITVDVCSQDSVGENRLLMVFSAEVDNKSYHYVTADINEQLQQNNVWYKTEFIFAVPDELKPRSVIKNYIWNIDKKNVLIDNFKIEIAKQTGY